MKVLMPHKQLFGILCLCLSLFANIAIANGNTLFRYKNADGVPVINNSIPAHYAQKGYEIINSAGEVLQVVPPAPSSADVEKAEQELKVLAAYETLKRRYSTIDDIEQAKQRKLANINTNISILNGSIENLKSNINTLVARAAEQERAGRKVHQSILTQLDATKAELKISEDLLEYRQNEHKETAAKYDYDIRAFIHGETLEKKKKASE